VRWDLKTLEECLNAVAGKLEEIPGDWEWLDLYRSTAERGRSMDLTATETETLFEELGTRGVTLVIHVDHTRLAGGKPPWAVQMSGPGTRDGGIQIDASDTFQKCLENGLTELSSSPGDWNWLDIYLELLTVT
jgi:hypothetical protein